MKKVHNFTLMLLFATIQTIWAQGLSFAYISPLPTDLYPNTPHKKETSVVVSHTLQMYMGTALNQGDCYAGVCYTLAKAYQMQYAQQHQLTAIAQIDAIAFNPFSLYNYLNEQNCKRQTTFEQVFELIQQKGICPQRIFPSQHCADSLTCEAQDSAMNYRIQNYTSLFQSQDDKALKVKRIKEAITNAYPIIVGVKVDENLHNLSAQTSDIWIPMSNTSHDSPLHSLLIIGFDDAKYGGSFQILNSWGSAWGNQGIAYIRYKDFLQHCVSAYTMHLAQTEK